MPDIQVMLADDHELVRQGLRTILEMEDDIHVIGEVDNGKSLLNNLETGNHPDVVLMDVQMPGMSGIEATRSLKSQWEDIQVVGLTAVDEDATIAQMLMAGACGYVIKSAAASDLVVAIRSAYSGQPALDAAIRRRVERYNERHGFGNGLNGHMGSAHIGYSKAMLSSQSENSLTRREVEVMRILMQGFSNKEIARRLIISERTVQTHLSNIFTKMDVTSRTEAVLIAIRDGWLPAH